jgi:hypothetical protein
LIIIVVSVKERFLPEDHAGKHASQRPHVEGVIVLLKVHQQLWTLEVPTCDSDIVFTSWVVEFRKAPINEPKLSFLVINHDVVGLDITMHHPVGMTIVQSLEELKDVVTNVIIAQGGIENFEVCIVDVFEDERRSLGLRVSDDIQKLNNVGPTAHILENFDFPLDFLLLDRFQNLDNTLGVVGHVDSFKHLFMD